MFSNGMAAVCAAIKARKIGSVGVRGPACPIRRYQASTSKVSSDIGFLVRGPISIVLTGPG
jgi:hypothetical protein